MAQSADVIYPAASDSSDVTYPASAVAAAGGPATPIELDRTGLTLYDPSTILSAVSGTTTPTATITTAGAHELPDVGACWTMPLTSLSTVNSSSVDANRLQGIIRAIASTCPTGGKVMVFVADNADPASAGQGYGCIVEYNGTGYQVSTCKCSAGTWSEVQAGANSASVAVESSPPPPYGGTNVRGMTAVSVDADGTPSATVTARQQDLSTLDMSGMTHIGFGFGAGAAIGGSTISAQFVTTLTEING